MFKLWQKNKIVLIALIFFSALVILLFSYRSSWDDRYFYLNINEIHIEDEQRGRLEPAEEIVEPVQKEITLLFGGDIMLSRTVNAKMERYEDYAWPFRLIAPAIAEADISVFNLESPFLKNANYDVPTGSFSFKANPLAVEGLLLSGIDVLSLANNHALNAGRQGVIDTLDILKEHDIAGIGLGLNEKEAREGVVLSEDAWRVAFLSYAYPRDYSLATETRAGIAFMNIDNLKEDIERLREDVDLVIVLMHAGTEYVNSPHAEQVNFARKAIDFGADVVIGHHPHWPQSWEIYKDKIIFYSLGNFVFDQMWSEATSHGLLARLTFQADLSGQAELLPVVIKDYGQVSLLSEDEDIASFWNLYDLEPPGEISW
jgi:poly-gamma-glutamate capsule biosynthesis protein CapA/YwtB (metallophosphatase superfamily)